jgi:peptide/nickel transport system ATP-binding protein
VTGLLEVRGLSVSAGSATLVRDLDLSLLPGQSMALVGESGSGKTSTALALMGYARPGTSIAAQTLRFGAHDLLVAPARDVRRLRGGSIGFVPQNPVTSLNPALRIESQFRDLLATHADRPAANNASISELLESVSLPGDRGFRRRYPHQLSGGQQQRVLIALALACGPDLVVLDEPTTGLDVTTQDHIVELIDEVRQRYGVSLLYVSHDLAVVAKVADRVAVMYGGQIVEDAPSDEIFTEPRHPYTRMLLDAVPRLEGERRMPVGIPGVAIGARWDGLGCVFSGRCPHRAEACESAQALRPVAEEHAVRCVRAEALAGERSRVAVLQSTSRISHDALLQIDGLTASYPRAHEPAVRDVDLAVRRGESVAVVGESGSGKSTLARCVVGLHGTWDGEIRFEGEPLTTLAGSRSRAQRQRIQIVFQNPDRSLNPRHTVGDMVARPCRQLLGLDATAAAARVRDLLEEVRLPAFYSGRYPSELSGGERQRVAIARALAAEPDLLVCDEITSALDVSIQASLVELLIRLQRSRRLSLLFISHDLGVVRALADWVVVMRHGAVRESRRAEELFESPDDEYTSALLHASPRLPRAAVG